MEKLSEIVGCVLRDEEGSENKLVELVALLEESADIEKRADIEMQEAGLKGMVRCYHHLLLERKGTWLQRPSAGDVEGDVVARYHVWMREVFDQCQQQLLSLLLHPDQHLAEVALTTVFQLLEYEGRGHQKVWSTYHFPNALLHSVMSVLLDTEGKRDGLIGACQRWLKYHDVLYHWLSNIASLVGAKVNAKATPPCESFISNVYTALCLVAMPTSNDELDSFLVGEPCPENKEAGPEGQRPVKKRRKVRGAMRGGVVTVLERYRKQFSNSWLAFLRLQLPPHTLRKVLVQLHSFVMPHLTDPRLLLDFLTEAYDQGGVVSLLSLNGLFILMNNYHLDCPSFYLKLYQLLTVSVLHVKYMPRLLILLDTFLSSTLLPLYLVAAFMKKLCRLALSAPPPAIVAVVILVTNLIKRHPNCRVLVHRPNEDYTFSSDPYDIDEPNPAKAGALESCLWELKTLRSHYSCDVAVEVDRLTSVGNLTAKQEISLNKHFSAMKDKPVVFENPGDCPLQYKEPDGLWE